MKLKFSNQKRNGSATLIVVILMFLMASLLSLNSKALFRLNQELGMIEKRQAKKFATAPAVESEPKTNSPAQK